MSAHASPREVTTGLSGAEWARLGRLVAISRAARHHRPREQPKLPAALAMMDAFPALAQAREEMLAAIRAKDIVAAASAAESDVALLLMLLRNRSSSREGTVTEILTALPRDRLETLILKTPSFDLLNPPQGWGVEPSRFRMHALAVQVVADSLARRIGLGKARSSVAAAALLHDIGKFALAQAYVGYPEPLLDGADSAEDRLRRERKEFGMDHATVGGALAMRWRLPRRIVTMISDHHRDDAGREAMIIRLADMLVNRQAEDTVPAARLAWVGHRIGVTLDDLREVLREASGRDEGRRPGIRAAQELCPLAPRERQVLQMLSERKVYNAIALDLGVSPSTVRTLVSKMYGQLGVRDRAHLVMLAADRGWID